MKARGGRDGEQIDTTEGQGDRVSYDGEYDASEYPDGIHAPRLGYRGAREMSELRAKKDAEIEGLRATLEKLRPCAHACGPAPCPHTRRFEEVTKSVLPPRRVKPYPAERGRR